MSWGVLPQCWEEGCKLRAICPCTGCNDPYCHKHISTHPCTDSQNRQGDEDIPKLEVKLPLYSLEQCQRVQEIMEELCQTDKKTNAARTS